jgi:hypothetical protein
VWGASNEVLEATEEPDLTLVPDVPVVSEVEAVEITEAVEAETVPVIQDFIAAWPEDRVGNPVSAAGKLRQMPVKERMAAFAAIARFSSIASGTTTARAARPNF